MKNSLTSNIDKDLMNEIRGSLFNPNGAYLRNLREVKEIDWSWNNGQTKTTITYGNNVTETRDNSEVPPTQACHDIAHFIAALNGNMEWDYVQHINHISEYNAVVIETILSKLCHTIQYGIEFDYDRDMMEVKEHMRWFSEDYYLISKFHPSKKTDKELLQDFLEIFDIDKATNAFQIFYEVWCIENSVGSGNFELEVNMGSDLDFYDERVYSYLYNAKKLLQSLL